MPKQPEKVTFVSKDGKHEITTSAPAEQVSLRAQGYRDKAAADATAAEQPGAKPEQGASDTAAQQDTTSAGASQAAAAGRRTSGRSK